MKIDNLPINPSFFPKPIEGTDKKEEEDMYDLDITIPTQGPLTPHQHTTTGVACSATCLSCQNTCGSCVSFDRRC